MSRTADRVEAETVGGQLRTWRQRRHLSQLDLALLTGVSARHLSFVETGRSTPSREMVTHLAHHLDIPIRSQNALLLAAGHAPAYRERDLGAPSMASVRQAVDLMLSHHDPYPAFVVDGAWNLVSANAGAGILIGQVSSELLTPPVNVIRVSLHPNGMASSVVNFDEYATHLVARLRHQCEHSGDLHLVALLDEVLSYPNVPSGRRHPNRDEAVLPLVLDVGGRELALFSTIATVGAPLDVTAAELAVESFFPADAVTAEFFRH